MYVWCFIDDQYSFSDNKVYIKCFDQCFSLFQQQCFPEKRLIKLVGTLLTFHYLSKIYDTGSLLWIMCIMQGYTWFSIFLEDIITLLEINEMNVKLINDDFSKGVFTVKKMINPFPSIWIKAMNRIIKSPKFIGVLFDYQKTKMLFLNGQLQVLLLVLSWNYLKSIVTDLLNANIMKIQSSLEKVS